MHEQIMVFMHEQIRIQVFLCYGHLTFFIFFVSTEQSYIGDIPLWKSDRGPLQN